MPVGNDVVDLQEPDNQAAAIHPRFDRRVFTDSELQLIEAGPTVDDRHVVRWTLWATKESVFKLVQQLDESISFRPRCFETRIAAPDLAEVTYQGSVFPVALDITRQRIHAVARNSSTMPVSGISQPACAPNSRDASILVRAQASVTIGERLGIEPGHIEIMGKIPRAIHNGKRLPVDISLSHHGRFLAHAVLGAAALFIVTLAGCSDSTDPGTTVSTARSLWQAQSLDSYTFDYRQSCFCPFTQPVHITVEAGEIVSVEPLTNQPPSDPNIAAFSTIDELLDWLETAEASNPVVFDVVYDELRGYPVSANVDISFQIADEEFSFEVSNLEVPE